MVFSAEESGWQIWFEGDTAGHDTDALVAQVAQQVQQFTDEHVEWIRTTEPQLGHRPSAVDLQRSLRRGTLGALPFAAPAVCSTHQWLIFAALAGSFRRRSRTRGNKFGGCVRELLRFPVVVLNGRDDLACDLVVGPVVVAGEDRSEAIGLPGRPRPVAWW
jgi:hypothetical protein